MNYFALSVYYDQVRSFLQDLVPPYRYPDATIFSSINTAISEMARIRPDIFLDLKYQQPLILAGPYNDGIPALLSATPNQNMILPIPQTYFMPVIWYVCGLIQFIDVDDTQDVRAQSFHQKFIGSMLTQAA